MKVLLNFGRNNRLNIKINIKKSPKNKNIKYSNIEQRVKYK